MRGVAKAVLASIFISMFLLIFSSFIYFFPWYATLVVETFNISQVVAGDNYLKESYYNDALDRLKSRPLYRDVAILVDKEGYDSGRSARGVDDEKVYENLSESEKPYRQRGESIIVTVKAKYPLHIKIMGEYHERLIEVSFKMKTVGLKHYKDLDYYDI